MTQTSISVQIEREVAFYDVDAYRIVWHGNYPRYFEEARCALLEEIGYSYTQMEEDGYFFPVVDMHIRYPKPLIFKQKISIQATLKEWQNRLVIRYLIIDSQTQEKLTKAKTVQVAVKMPDQTTLFESPNCFTQKIEQYLLNQSSD